MTNPMDKEKSTGLLNFRTYPTYQISRFYLYRFLTECKHNTQTDGWMDRPKPICLLNLFEVGVLVTEFCRQSVANLRKNDDL